jgi:peptidyl-prolyl cis-trans isomerase A (cyclophilin A)
MKRSPIPLLLSLFALASSADAQITADMVVSQSGSTIGTITIELDHAAAPMATGNFIGLASGTLAWIDSTTGVVQYNKPYYNGLTFHRIIDGFMNQGGSQNGLGNDGPGYVFQDGVEINNGLDHALPYRISMANSGLDSNGSQFFLTVAATAWLDGKHIVFGQIKETGPSRGFVDSINNLEVVDAENSDDRPVVPVIIDSVTVHYNGVTFDPHDQGLPAVSSPALDAPIKPSTGDIGFNQPAGSTFHLAYSGDLTNWTKSSTRTLGIEGSPLTSFPVPAGAIGASRQFFSPALVSEHPDTWMPSTIANQTLTVEFNAPAPMVFVFDATGSTASWSHQDQSGSAIIVHSYSFIHYQAYFALELSNFVDRYWQFDSMRLTTGTTTEITGSHSVKLFDINGMNGRDASGTFTLTK